MPQVTFYLLTSGNLTAGQFACRLTDKVWRNNHTVHIHTANAKTSQQLDKLLWEWREDSFIPHQIITSGDQADTPVTIGCNNDYPMVASKILINLTQTIPSFYDPFDRVCEIVAQDNDSLNASREKFREYRKAGITPETFKI